MRKSLQLLAVASVLACPACSGGGNSQRVQSIVFQLTDILPSDSSAAVPLSSEIALFFTNPVNAATLDVDSVRIVAESGDVIAGTRRVVGLSGRQVRFVPTFGYVPFALHMVHVSVSLQDTSGSPLDRNYDFVFQAAGQGPTLLTQGQIENLGDRLLFGRWFHRMTRMANNRFLVAGGYVGAGSVTDRAENLIPALKQSFDVGDSMRQPRAGHVQLLLPSGRVLLAGGENNDNPFTPLAGCEIFDPTGFTFQLVAPMNFARSFAHGVVLPDGRVLVSGGQSLDAAGSFIFRDDAEIYDPAADRWTLVAGTMSMGRSGHFTAVGPNGEVVVVGGRSTAASGELFNPATGQFAPEINQPGSTHAFGAGTLLADGRPWVAGGIGSRGVTIHSVAFGFLKGLNQTQDERAFASATALEDGRVLLIGGIDLSSTPALIRDSLEVFIPIGETGKMFRAPNVRLPHPTSHHAAALGPDGNVWITGGLPTDLQDPALRQVVLIHPG